MEKTHPDQILVGDVFGAWTVLSFERARTGKSLSLRLIAQCECECGTRMDVLGWSLASGKSTQCAACAVRKMSSALITHGFAALREQRKHRLYQIWSGVKQRTENPNVANFSRYGGRGIQLCDAWHDFDVFRDWAENNGYAADLQLDRIDNDKGYGPENCRWADQLTQNRNKASNLVITAFGETKCASAWADDARCAVSATTLRNRIKAGWPTETALLQPSACARSR